MSGAWPNCSPFRHPVLQFASRRAQFVCKALSFFRADEALQSLPRYSAIGVFEAMISPSSSWTRSFHLLALMDSGAAG